MAEKLRITLKKKLCELTFEHIDMMEIHKDIMDGDSLITSFLTEVSCLRFRQCNHRCLFKKDIPEEKIQNPKSSKKNKGAK